MSSPEMRAGISVTSLQALFLAVEGDELQRGVELVVGEDAGSLDDTRHAAGIVIGPRIIHRIEVRADKVDLIGIHPSGQSGHDVVVGGRLVGERIERGVQPEALKLVEDVGPRQIVLGAESTVITRMRVEAPIEKGGIVRLADLADDVMDCGGRSRQREQQRREDGKGEKALAMHGSTLHPGCPIILRILARARLSTLLALFLNHLQSTDGGLTEGPVLILEQFPEGRDRCLGLGPDPPQGLGGGETAA